MGSAVATLDEAPMSVECSMLAVCPERCKVLRADPKAPGDEALLRSALGHLAAMSYFKRDASEAEVLAEIRTNRSGHTSGSPTERQGMVELYARQDALLDAALARGDQETAFGLGSSWQYYYDILGDAEGGEAVRHFFDGAPRVGESLTYGPAGLHDPAAVAAFAGWLDLWSPERFAAAAAARREPGLAEKLGVTPQFLAEQDGQHFLRFKTYIQDAAAVGAGILIWMS
jgi:hypothetical protein